MTCIAGLVHGGKVYIGGDSAGVAGLDLMVRADAKVFRVKEFLFGFTSSFRMGQLLRYSLQIPPRDPDISLDQYMATSFIDNIRHYLKQGGYASKENEAESAGTFLVGHAGRLFIIESDYQVGESVCRYDAVGCGQGYAKGSLFSTPDMEPQTRIEQALKAAEAHSAGVRGPFVVESV